MKVVCVEKFLGLFSYNGEPMPVVDSVYTVIGTRIDAAGDLGYRLNEFLEYGFYTARKFRPITTEDFRWESIDEVLQNVTSEVHNG